MSVNLGWDSLPALAAEGLTLAEAAARLGRKQNTVWVAAKREGITFRSATPSPEQARESGRAGGKASAAKNAGPLHAKRLKIGREIKESREAFQGPELWEIAGMERGWWPRKAAA